MAEPYESYWYAEVDEDAVGKAILDEAGISAVGGPCSTHAKARVMVGLPSPDGPEAQKYAAQGRLRIWADQHARVWGPGAASQWKQADVAAVGVGP